MGAQLLQSVLSDGLYYNLRLIGGMKNNTAMFDCASVVACGMHFAGDYFLLVILILLLLIPPNVHFLFHASFLHGVQLCC